MCITSMLYYRSVNIMVFGSFNCFQDYNNLRLQNISHYSNLITLLNDGNLTLLIGGGYNNLYNWQKYTY